MDTLRCTAIQQEVTTLLAEPWHLTKLPAEATTVAWVIAPDLNRCYLENTTAVGYLAVPTASNQVRIGNTSVTSIGGEVEWTAFSDGRFKKEIKEDVSGLEFIRDLRPVSYTVDKAELNKFLHVKDSIQIKLRPKVFLHVKQDLSHKK